MVIEFDKHPRPRPRPSPSRLRKNWSTDLAYSPRHSPPDLAGPLLERTGEIIEVELSPIVRDTGGSCRRPCRRPVVVLLGRGWLLGCLSRVAVF